MQDLFFAFSAEIGLVLWAIRRDKESRNATTNKRRLPEEEEENYRIKSHVEGKHLEQQERQALVVWLYTLKPIKQLKKFGNIHYISKRLKYIYLYVVEDEVESVITLIDIPLARVRAIIATRTSYGFHADSSRITRKSKRKQRKSCRTIIKRSRAL